MHIKLNIQVFFRRVIVPFVTGSHTARLQDRSSVFIGAQLCPPIQVSRLGVGCRHSGTSNGDFLTATQSNMYIQKSQRNPTHLAGELALRTG